MQQVWKNRWRKTGWAVLSVGTLCLLVAAVYKKNNKACVGIEVAMVNNENNYFVDEKEVVASLKSQGAVEGQEITNIHLHHLESVLENSKWIENAELFFDNRQILQVRIEEKEPIARVFTANGSSFYIDSMCRRLPLSDKMSARVPMFTSFPSDRETLSKPDSGLLTSVKDLAMYIHSDDFWKSQVAQIDITPDGFEMIPTVGSHIVALGKDGDYEKKFDRLFSFYKQVWTKVGFEKYDRLDVRFAGQVVATLKGTTLTKMDTAKATAIYSSLVATDSQVNDSLPLSGKTQAELSKGNMKDSVKSKLVNVKQVKPTSNKIILKEPVVATKNKTIAAKEIVVKVVAKSNVKENKLSSKAAVKTTDKKIPKAVFKKAT